MSERILDHLVDANGLELGPLFADRASLGLVKDLMRGSMAADSAGARGTGRRWVWEPGRGRRRGGAGLRSRKPPPWAAHGLASLGP
jgi:hypothetical protein